jgi:DNA-binding XRE family transcriptional regulator
MKSQIDTQTYLPNWMTPSTPPGQPVQNPREIKTAIAHNLRQLRKSRGLSRPSLARRAGTSPHSLQEIEAGRVLPGYELLWRLAQALGVECADFLAQDALPPVTAAFIPKK